MSSKGEQGSVHMLTLVLGLSAFVVVASIVPINRHYNGGKSNVAGVNLAKGGDDSGSSGSSEDSDSDDSGKISTPSPQPKVETKEVKQNLRVETRTTPEKIKTEIREGNLRVKFEIEDGKVKIKTEVKSEDEEIELEDEAEDEALDEVETELEKEDVKIATAEGQMALVHKRVGALSNFPISVDPSSRQLTITTPAGSKIVTVLPQQAVDNMLASKVMDDVVGEKAGDSLASIPDLVKLEVKDGVLVYKVKGNKNHKLLGFIPIKTGVEAFVSAENGEVVETNQSLLGRILNRLAP